MNYSFKRAFTGILLCTSLFSTAFSCYAQPQNKVISEHTHHHHHHKREAEIVSPIISINKDNKINENDSLYVPVSVNELTCSGLELEIHYDTHLFNTPYDVYNSVSLDASASEFCTINFNEPGTIKATYLFKKNKTLSGQLLYFYLNSKNIDKDEKSYIDILVGTVIDQNNQKINVSSTGGYVSIKNRNDTPSETTYKTYHQAYLNNSSVHKDDTLIYTLGRTYGDNYQSAEIQVEYNREILAFDSIEFKGDIVSNPRNIHTYNANITGAVFITIINENDITSYSDLFDLKFKVLKDVDMESEIKTTFKKIGTANYKNVLSDPITKAFNVAVKPNIPVTPSFYINDVKTDSAFQFDVNLYIDAKSNLGAGDITVDFDATYLTYICGKTSEITGVLLGIGDKNANTGKIKVSVLSTSGLQEAVKLVTFTFKAVSKDLDTTTSINISGKNITDPLTNPINLDFKNSTIILNKHTHSFSDWSITKRENCEEDGLEERTCLCGEVETRVRPATGHNFSEWKVITPATCTTDGLERRTCSLCSKVEERVITASGHKFSEWIRIKTPTCTETGLEERTCSVCGEKETRVVPKLDHKTATRIENKVEPTCTEQGSYDLITYCEDCETVIKTEHKIIEAKGHNWNPEWTIDKEPTCIESGSKSHHCLDCDAKKDITEIPATGHKETTRIENRVEPTCTKEGCYDLVTYCENCGMVIKTEHKIIEPTSHSYGEWVQVKAPTTEEAGLEERTCSVCGEKETRVVPKLEPEIPDVPKNPEENPNDSKNIIIYVTVGVATIMLITVVIFIVSHKKKHK